jgi:uncharacterized protein (DUF2062 family)
MWRQWTYIRQFKLNFLRLARQRGTPDEIAKGLALGIFVGMTPTFGVQMLLAVLLAFVLKENKLAAAAGVWITNPLTAPFIYALEYESGRLLLGLPRLRLPQELSFSAMQSLGYDFMIPLWTASLIYGVICASLTFALTLRLFPLIKAWRIPRWPRPKRK